MCVCAREIYRLSYGTPSGRTRSRRPQIATRYFAIATRDWLCSADCVSHLKGQGGKYKLLLD